MTAEKSGKLTSLGYWIPVTLVGKNLAIKSINDRYKKSDNGQQTERAV